MRPNTETPANTASHKDLFGVGILKLDQKFEERCEPRPHEFRKEAFPKGRKIALLWAWGIALCVVLIQITSRTTNFVPGFILIGALLAILVTLSAITWKWLGGKEQ
jgi:hypothetical protein